MWQMTEGVWQVALRTGLIYAAILLVLRLSGKREVGQMTSLELVMLLLVANGVQNAMTGPDTSIAGGLVAAGTLLGANNLLTWLTWRYRKLRRLVEGAPTLLVHKGQPLKPNLARERITMDELHQALREHGILSISDVSHAVLEVDGTISVVRHEDLREGEHSGRRLALRVRRGD